MEETWNISLLLCCNLYQDSIIEIFYCSVVALSKLMRLSCDSHICLILVSIVCLDVSPKIP